MKIYTPRIFDAIDHLKYTQPVVIQAKHSEDRFSPTALNKYLSHKFDRRKYGAESVAALKGAIKIYGALSDEGTKLGRNHEIGFNCFNAFDLSPEAVGAFLLHRVPIGRLRGQVDNTVYKKLFHLWRLLHALDLNPKMAAKEKGNLLLMILGLERDMEVVVLAVLAEICKLMPYSLVTIEEEASARRYPLGALKKERKTIKTIIEPSLELLKISGYEKLAAELEDYVLCESRSYGHEVETLSRYFYPACVERIEYDSPDFGSQDGLITDAYLETLADNFEKLFPDCEVGVRRKGLNSIYRKILSRCKAKTLTVAEKRAEFDVKVRGLFYDYLAVRIATPSDNKEECYHIARKVIGTYDLSGAEETGRYKWEKHLSSDYFSNPAIRMGGKAQYEALHLIFKDRDQNVLIEVQIHTDTTLREATVGKAPWLAYKCARLPLPDNVWQMVLSNKEPKERYRILREQLLDNKRAYVFDENLRLLEVNREKNGTTRKPTVKDFINAAGAKTPDKASGVMLFRLAGMCRMEADLGTEIEHGDQIIIESEIDKSERSAPGQVPVANPSTGKPLIGLLPDYEGSLKDAEALAATDTKAAAEVYREILKYGNANAMKAAIIALNGIEEEAAIQLLGVALSYGNDEVRKVAAEAIPGKGRAAVEKLAAALEDGEGKENTAIIQALGKIGAAGIPALENEVFKSERSKDKMRVLAKTLGEIRHRAVIPLLDHMMLNPDISVQKAAIAELKKVGVAAVPKLKRIMKVWDVELRKAAAEALLALDLFKKQAEKDEVEAHLRVAERDWPAVMALGIAAIPALKRELGDFKGQRKIAVQLLGRLAGNQEAKRIVMETINDQNIEVARAAMQELGLGQIDTPSAIDALLRLLNNDQANQDEQKIAAIETLGEICKQTTMTGEVSQQAVAALLQRIDGKYNDKITFAAAKALVKINRFAAQDIKKKVTAYAYVAERKWSAIAALGQAAIPALTRALKNWDLIDGAIGALEKIGPAAIPLLEEVRTKHWSKNMKRLAANSLMKLYLEADEENKRRLSAYVYVAEGKWSKIIALGPAAIPALTMALTDWNKKVREKSQRILNHLAAKRKGNGEGRI